MIRLRYEGRLPAVEGLTLDLRLWTIMTSYTGPDGGQYGGSTRTLDGLKELGIIHD